MSKLTMRTILGLSTLFVFTFAVDRPVCPPPAFETVRGFNLGAFSAKRWYIQEQMQVSAVPSHAHFCIHANYKKLDKKTFWGYDIQVHNVAADDAPPHHVHDSGTFICAKIVDEDRGKLSVGPCFVPSFFAGPYWVLAYDETEGYALISGGAPSYSFPGGCRTGTGLNNAGLWIFTRAKDRDEALVEKVRKMAQEDFGFDTSVLEHANQTVCNEQGSIFAWDDQPSRVIV